MKNYKTFLESDGEEKWITIFHRHVKVDANGNIVAGMGGKFNGKPVAHAVDHLTNKHKDTPYKPEKESTKKIHQAIKIIKNNSDLSAKEIKDIFVKNLNMTVGMANVYFHKIKKQLKDEEPKEIEKVPEVEKVEPKKEPESVEPNIEDAAKIVKTLKTIHGAKYSKYMASHAIKDKFKISDYGDAAELHDKAVEHLNKKPEVKEKSPKKYQQAIEIFKNSKGMSSKEIKAKFKSEIGLSDAVASAYYHKIKKQLSDHNDIDKSEKTSKNDDKNTNSLKDQIYQYVKDNHGTKQGIDIINDLKKMHNLSTSDALMHYTTANNKLPEKPIEKTSNSDVKDKDSNKLSAKTYASIENEAKALYAKHKHANNDTELINIIKNETGILHSQAWTMHEKFKKNIDNHNDHHKLVKKAYDIYKKGKEADHFTSEITNKIKNDLDVSIHKSFDLHDEAQTMHSAFSNTELDKHVKDAVTIYKDKVGKKSKGEIMNDMEDHFDISSHDSAKLYYKAQKIHDEGPQSKDEILRNQVADIIKAGKAKYKTKNEILAYMQDKLKMGHEESSKLYNITTNTSYKDIADKADEHNGGTKIYNEHNEKTYDISDPVLHTFHSKFKVAKSVWAHEALDKHTHLFSPLSPGFYDLPQETIDMSKAVRSYTGSYYDDINSVLRKTKKHNKDHRAHVKGIVKHLDAAFKHKSAKIKKETVVYRGYANNFANHLQAGDIFQDKGFVSTSAKQQLAESWAGSDGTVMHILTPKGSKALSVKEVSTFGDSESEILLNRGTKFRIISREGNVVHAEIIT